MISSSLYLEGRKSLITAADMMGVDASGNKDEGVEYNVWLLVP